MIDGAETTQITFVGQIRNISTQTTNITYKLDDGTSTIEVKLWVDSDAAQEESHSDPSKPRLTENAYARVWGRLKEFNNKRHVGAHVIRPIADYNEIQYHLLEATAVHLHFSRGPPNPADAKGGANANGQQGGYGAGQDRGYGGDKKLPNTASSAARKVYTCLSTTPQTNEGLHAQDIATRIGVDVGDVMRAAEELNALGVVYSTVDEHTWALLDV
ncbi:Replication factor A protein 2 [Elasticomyces elasticus]|nr:Replication factor A protein 2 [Elasticomyces elasticus]